MELKFDKDTVSGYKTNFDSEKSSFNNNSLLTFRYGYISTSQDPLVSQMASNLSSLYGKIETGYNNIDTYWTDYMDASDSLETSFKTFSANCSDATVNAFLSGFINNISDNYYVPDTSGVTFEDYYRNITVENNKVTITMSSDGLSKFEKEYKTWCESQGYEVEVVCYTLDENGNYNLTTVNPELKEKENELIDRCAEEGISITITEDTRTVDEQNSLYASGRTEAGSWKTDKKGDGYNSDHQWGIAFDVYVNGENGENTYDDPKYLNDWDRVGEIGKEIGLEWGGDWEELDKPHFNLKNTVVDYTDEEHTTSNLTVTEENILPNGTSTYKKHTYENPKDYSETWNLDD